MKFKPGDLLIINENAVKYAGAKKGQTCRLIGHIGMIVITDRKLKCDNGKGNSKYWEENCFDKLDSKLSKLLFGQD